MSNVKYCIECGNKIEYSYSPPKFCSNCGTQVGVAAKKETFNSPAKRRISKSRELEEGFTDSDFVPNIDKLDLDVEFDNNVISMNGTDDKGIHFSQSKFKPRSKSV